MRRALRPLAPIALAPLALASVGTASAQPRSTDGSALAQRESAPVPPEDAGTSPVPAEASSALVVPPTTHEPSSLGAPPRPTPLLRAREAVVPPPTNIVYFQYGVALGAEVVSSAGPVCDDQAAPCILGTGGGVTVRAGLRTSGPFYVGGAYSFSKQDPNKLFRLAILQQARAEARYYFQTARDVEPYLQLGAGIAGYGNEWTIDTYGPTGAFGGGLEVQLTRRTVVGIAGCYRLLLLHGFSDSSGTARAGGIAQFIGLDLVLEQRDPMFTTATQ